MYRNSILIEEVNGKSYFHAKKTKWEKESDGSWKLSEINMPTDEIKRLINNVTNEEIPRV